MTDKSHIEDSIVKFSAYISLITSDEDIARLKVGDIKLADEAFYKCLNLELYTFILTYILDWFDVDDDLMTDSPLTYDEINNIIDNGDEIIKSIIELPLNY
jgi:hypothetical protein